MPEEHQYALDAHNQWVDARDTPFIRHARYFCDCPQRHRLKHVKPKERMHYFAHISAGTKRKPTETPCGSGGESMQHRLAKHRLRECVNSLAFVIESCTKCCREIVVHFHDCTVQLEMRSANGRWRYDCMVYDNEGGRVCALEIAHTHFSTEGKIRDTLKTEGLMMAEFLAEDVMAWDTTSRLHNLLMEHTECLLCAWKAARQVELHAESYGWKQLEDDILHWWDVKVRNDTFDLIYKRQIDSIGKAIHVLCHFKDSIRMHLGRPQWGSVPLDSLTMQQTPQGFLLFTQDTYVPASQMFLLVIDPDWEDDCGRRLWVELRRIWETYGVRTDLVVGLRCDYVLTKLKDLRAEMEVEFRSCLYPILKNLERTHSICARCGKWGHASEKCFRKFCTRCGRGGHEWADCHALTNLKGSSI